MKRATLLLLSAVLFGGCWSEAANQSNLSNSNGSDTSSNTEAGNELVLLEGFDPNAFNGNSSNIPIVNRSTGNADNPIGPRRSVDDSTIEASMDNKGDFIEQRTFNSHPLLLKVERKTVGETRTIKVTLKDGRVFEIPGEKMEDFNTLDPANILLAVGVQPPRVNRTPPPGAEEKTKESGKN